MNACSGDRKRERTYEGESVHVRDDDFIIQCNRDGLGFRRGKEAYIEIVAATGLGEGRASFRGGC